MLKKNYIEKMYKKYLAIEDLQKLLDINGIVNFLVKKDEIIFNFRNKLKFIIKKIDKRIFPIELMNFGEYETLIENFILKKIKLKNVIFDVGANHGFYSMMLKLKNPKSKIYAFEPVVDTFLTLKNNHKINKLKNELFNFGFHEKKMTSKIFFDPRNSAAASIKNTQKVNTYEEIKLDTIDNFVSKKKIKVIDLIKCDVEGAEYFVFKGAKKTIQNYKPIIICEILRKFCKVYKYKPNDIIINLKLYNYRCFQFEKNIVREINSITNKTLPTNFLFLHNKKHAQIIKNLKNK